MGIVRLSTWPRYAERAAQLRREEGLWGLSWRVLRRLIAPVVDFGAVTFFERRLDDGAIDPAAGAAVQEMTRADMARLITAIDPEQTIEDINARFRRGDRVFVAIGDDGAGEHTRWVTTSRTYIPEIDRDIVPAAGQAYFYNGYTRPECRGHGVDGRVRNRIFATLQSEGFTTACSYVRHDNRKGYRAAFRWQRPIGTVRYLRVFRGPSIVFGGRHAGTPELIRRDRGDEAVLREQAWRSWFRSWIAQPLSARSTGCYQVRDSDCRAAAASIVSLLNLTAGDDVLDVGCDSALISRLVAPQCRRFAGVDFIPEMLRDARDRVMDPATVDRARFIAADGRALPIRSGAFPKVYCSAVLHTLATHADGQAMIDELIRVTADGGKVLLASVPDRAKRGANRALVWQRAPLAGKLTLPLRWVVPPAARRWGRRILRRPETGPPAFLEYDLQQIAAALEGRGLRSVIHDFPADHPNLDFQRTRSNLVITVRHSARGGPSGLQ